MTALKSYRSPIFTFTNLGRARLSSLGLNVGVFHPDRAVVEATDLLRVNHTLLGTAGSAVVNLSLPGGNTIQEHLFNVLESLSSCLWEQEESVDCHGCAEDTEDNVDLPLNVDKCRGHEVGQCKVLIWSVIVLEN